ncbi:NB-ARC domain-containing protein [Actinomadura rupiterrae]|uniref:NB-ARC domain-containing protein n=1 Tax=Actinomadura rupiterrae TaxID=559627 RepID=UPI0020A4978A|nr:NB-ARC domain-containing protein [Actinomadura rupiterrae]MCP2341841.1 tetratricopeptide (TPR) repeat protein [Actinomadura rupiterrae]
MSDVPPAKGLSADSPSETPSSGTPEPASSPQPAGTPSPVPAGTPSPQPVSGDWPPSGDAKGARAGAGAALPPAQLPADLPDFTGRDDETARLAAALTTRNGSAVPVVTVAGLGGIGKTALALHVAHTVRDAFPDGQLYAELHGTGPAPAAPAGVLAEFLRALGAPDREIPPEPDRRAALLRSHLAGRRVLVVLDDARDAAQIAPLLPGETGSAVLVTGRTRLAELPVAAHLDLAPFTPEAATALLERVAGPERITADPDAALRLVHASGLLPLAVRIVASRLAARPRMRPAVLAGRLADERRRLGELRIGDEAVESCFALGYAQLGIEEARAFRLLALHEGPDFSVEAAAALLDLDVLDAEDLCESLVDSGLLECRAPGRYVYHSLLRLYARGLAESGDGPVSCARALERLLEHFLAGIRGLFRQTFALYQVYSEPEVVAAHSAAADALHTGLHFADAAEMIAWMRAENRNVMAAIHGYLAGGGSPGRLVGRLFVVPSLADRTTVPAELLPAGVLFAMGAGARVMGAADEAICLLTDALDGLTGDDAFISRAHGQLSLAYAETGMPEEARRHGLAGLALAGPAADANAEGLCWLGLGVASLYAGDPRRALDELETAGEIFRTRGMPLREAWCLPRTIVAHMQLGQPAEAVEVGTRAAELFGRIGDDYLRGRVLALTAVALDELDRPDEAAEARAAAETPWRKSGLSLNVPDQKLVEGRTRRRSPDPGPA